MERCILELDITGAERLWQYIAPHMPQPKSTDETLATLHMARTATEKAHWRLRCYSHSWLCERSLPSQLPDHLKPRAERIYPWIVRAAAFTFNTRSPYLKPLKPLVLKAIDERMNELWADKRNDDATVLKEIDETKKRTIKKYIGII